jgi:uncharacterized protein YndB with AHSA1/START domain
MTAFAYRLDRTVVIRAPRDLVFRFFTDTPRWASWWGSGSTIDARPGGRMLIRYPGGNEASGEVVEVSPPERIVFTYGYNSGTPAIPPGGSRVTIRLDAHEDGTLVRLSHELNDAALRDEHVQGWRYQLSLFANVVTNELHAHAADLVDRWFAAWNEKDAAARQATMSAIAEPAIQFRDRFSVIDGVDELLPQMAAMHHFMAGFRIERRHDVRQCQGHVLADWVVFTGDREVGSGTNLFVLDAHGRMASVVGFWGTARS